MRTRNRFIGAALATGAMMVSGIGHPALAQQGIKAPGTKAPAVVPTLQIHFDRCISTRTRQDDIMTLQGNVMVLPSAGSPVAFTTGQNEIIFDISQGTIPQDNLDKKGNSGKKNAPHSMIIHVPMNLSTMKVSVTPAGTVFEDQCGNKLTVEAAPADQ